jgi:hypothetical protein
MQLPNSLGRPTNYHNLLQLQTLKTQEQGIGHNNLKDEKHSSINYEYFPCGAPLLAYAPEILLHPLDFPIVAFSVRIVAFSFKMLAISLLDPRLAASKIDEYVEKLFCKERLRVRCQSIRFINLDNTTVKSSDWLRSTSDGVKATFKAPIESSCTCTINKGGEGEGSPPRS